MWINEIEIVMEVKRQNYTVSLLKLRMKSGKIKFYSVIHKAPIDDKFREKLNGMPYSYKYQTEKQARSRFRLLVAIPVNIEEIEKSSIVS